MYSTSLINMLMVVIGLMSFTVGTVLDLASLFKQISLPVANFYGISPLAKKLLMILVSPSAIWRFSGEIWSRDFQYFMILSEKKSHEQALSILMLFKALSIYSTFTLFIYSPSRRILTSLLSLYSSLKNLLISSPIFIGSLVIVNSAAFEVIFKSVMKGFDWLLSCVIHWMVLWNSDISLFSSICSNCSIRLLYDLDRLFLIVCLIFLAKARFFSVLFMLSLKSHSSCTNSASG